MGLTKGALRTTVQRRLGDRPSIVWSSEEIDGYLEDGYAEIAGALHVFWDQVYLENLPRGFSYTHAWERALVRSRSRSLDDGQANYTCADERDRASDRIGPGTHTCPGEVALDTSAIPGLVDVPTTLTALERVTYDDRAVDAVDGRTLARSDSRYRITEGDVIAYTWQQEGVRALRKIRVPSQQATIVSVTGSFGILRRPTDLSPDTVTGSWGLPRRIPGQHPLGPEGFGLARRPYRDGLNVRVEHYRAGRSLDTARALCELPDRYAVALQDYAQGQCLAHAGPGQDVTLANLFAQRWARALARLERRLTAVTGERRGVLGGAASHQTRRPPRPSYPWPYPAQGRS